MKAYAGGAVRGLQPAVDSDPGRDRAILSFWWMGPAIYVACTTFAPLTGVRPEADGRMGARVRPSSGREDLVAMAEFVRSAAAHDPHRSVIASRLRSLQRAWGLSGAGLSPPT